MKVSSNKKNLKFIISYAISGVTFVGYLILNPLELLFKKLIRLYLKSELVFHKFITFIKTFKINKNKTEMLRFPKVTRVKSKSIKNVSSKKVFDTPLPIKIMIPAKVSFFILGAFFAIVFLFFPFQVYAWFRQLPNPELLSEQATNASTKITDRNGRILYEIYVDRDYKPVPLSAIPDNVIKATLAIEDSEFYQHSGVRLNSMVRAAKATIFDDTLQGASTITQQLVKNVFLTPERTLPRKIKEVVLSLLVETKYSKDEILEFYLNNIPYGGTAWGVQSGAKKYFGKDIKDLDLAEAAYLAGMPSAPSVYLQDEELAKERQKQVLLRMVALDYITQEEADTALEEELNFATQTQYIRAPHFVQYVRNELEKMYGTRATNFGGLTVKTTLDLDLQERAQEIVRTEVAANKNLNISNGAAVVLDTKTREILAYVGSIDYFKEGFGAFDVVTAPRQPGSSIKPVTYALAFEKGYTPASIIDDSPVSYQSVNQVYKPVNYDGKFHGNVTIRAALANSYNIPAVKLVKNVGPDNMVDLGMRMGLKNWKVDGSYGLAVTLGGKEVRLLDLANVYATFGDQGTYQDTTPFISVKDVYGYEIYKPDRRERTEAIKQGVAYLISNILSDYNARLPAFGTRNFLSIPGQTIAVKTGTTDTKRDNWTLGYTPSYTVGVWVGNNDNSPMNQYLASGISGAAPIWNKIFSAVLENKKNEPFVVPESIQVFVDKNCGNKSEVFLKGSNIPKTLCTAEKKDSDKKD